MEDKEYFEKIASDNKGITAVMHSPRILARYRDFLERTVLKKIMKRENKKILDIGCGNGRFFDFFHSYGREIHGIDFSPSLIKQASALYPETHTKVTSSEKLPYSKEEFDEVYMLLLFSHTNYNSFKETLSEASRVLKRGGRIIVLDEPESNGSVWKKKDIDSELATSHIYFIDSYFVRSDFATRLLLATMPREKRESASRITESEKEAVVKGNFIKGLLRVFTDMWIDIPSVLFSRRSAGVEQLLVYRKHG